MLLGTQRKYMNDKSKDDLSNTIYGQLVIITLLPEVLQLLLETFRFFMNKIKLPDIVTIVAVIPEAAYAFGVSILVFKVLPTCGSFLAFFIIHGITITPSIMKLLEYTTFSKKTIKTHCIKFIVDICNFASQVIGLIVLTIAVVSSFAGIKSSQESQYVAALAIIIVSLKYWENFVDSKILNIDFKQFKTNIQDHKPILNFISLPIKIGIIVGMAYTFNKDIDWKGSLSDRESQKDSSASFTSERVLLITNCISSFCLFHICHIACQLRMQIFSLATPLIVFSGPVLAGLIALQCEGFIDPIKTKTVGLEFSFYADYKNGNKSSILFFGIFWLIGIVITTRHIWTEPRDKESKIETLFTNTNFTTFAPVCNILFSRKQYADDYQVHEDYQFGAYQHLPEVNVNENIQNSPEVIACATMWHETKDEMKQLIKSIVILSRDCYRKRTVSQKANYLKSEYFNFSAHIFFDDCMTLKEDKKRKGNFFVVNEYVRRLQEVISETLSLFETNKTDEVINQSPRKYRTPYGGRLVWVLPGNIELVVHLKDKHKIRHKKRWSQCMYMYYLIMFKLLENGKALQDSSDAWKKIVYTGSEYIKSLNQASLKKLANTYILALDGDVTFKPKAIEYLVECMKQNIQTGAVCGRIHPTGRGPMVWYQAFEYAVGHWFQKAAEHIFGSVLCSPGCFSLFRVAALLDNNVMKTYLSIATEPEHFIQYDMGEDRWLCTLLIQQGHRVDYIAASDALTVAPESFSEFFKQRKRWIPSTLANIVDLLSSHRNVKNPNISKFFIWYQFFLLVSTILGPSTIIIAIASALDTMFQDWDLWICFLLSLAPCIVYIVICLTTKLKTQIKVAQFLSTVYSCVMLIVLVSIIKSFVDDNILNPSLLFIVIVAAVFVFGGLLHPEEASCLIYGILYFLFIPAGYLFLNIFSICNLHDINWGTRETPKVKTKAELERERKLAEDREKNKKRSWYSGLLERLIRDISAIFAPILNNRKKSIEESNLIFMLKILGKDIKKLRQVIVNISNKQLEHENVEDTDDEMMENIDNSLKNLKDEKDEEEKNQENKVEEITCEPEDIEELRIQFENWNTASWINDTELNSFLTDELDKDEITFWKQLIKKHLQPFEKNERKEKQKGAALIELRNSMCFMYWFSNALWILLNYLLMSDQSLFISMFGSRVHGLGVVFMVLFTVLLFFQTMGLILHQWETFVKVISNIQLSRKKLSQGEMRLNQLYHEFYGKSQNQTNNMKYPPQYDKYRNINEQNNKRFQGNRPQNIYREAPV
ncbi:DgyrCDS3701 [Dimorphilus gyrociliatus]|uniref:chitin synthase n=1 Tax=Dimorphilus gyrociliatus TaxID=2664684 RepID=A0A7I8VGX0_9ANNE|nr:DgyrCDS3701 [Dimorphilus gyrociliatus]